jgi:hypothetical protein
MLPASWRVEAGDVGAQFLGLYAKPPPVGCSRLPPAIKATLGSVSQYCGLILVRCKFLEICTGGRLSWVDALAGIACAGNNGAVFSD